MPHPQSQPRESADGAAAIDDRQLVERFLASRDDAAFRALYRTHTPYLWAIARRLARGGDAEAEELVQETWARSVKLLPRFSWRSALRTWLAGILFNCHRERRRKLGGRISELPAARSDRGTSAAADELRIDLVRALAGLTDRARTVLLLFDLEGYSHEEIAERLRIPVGTSRSRLNTARKALRRELQRERDTP